MDKDPKADIVPVALGIQVATLLSVSARFWPILCEAEYRNACVVIVCDVINLYLTLSAICNPSDEPKWSTLNIFTGLTYRYFLLHIKKFFMSWTCELKTPISQEYK